MENKPTDQEILTHLKKHDPILKTIIERIGPIRVEYKSRDFGALLETILRQQLARNAADTILARFLELYNNNTPTPNQLLHTPDAKLKSAGISPQKLTYIKDLASKIVDGTIDFSKFTKMPDEEVAEQLMKVKGIGRWTSEMFLMFSLGRLDILPTGDLAFRKAIQQAYGFKEPPNHEEITSIGEKWRPYRSVGTIYLWRSRRL